MKNITTTLSNRCGVIAGAAQSQTLGGLLPSLGSLLRTDSIDNDYVKEVTVYKSVEDSLALSCAWKRLREIQTSVFAISELQSAELYKQVNDEDRFLAESIRDYYQKRIMMWKLKGINLSSFRSDLETYLVNHGKVYEKDQIGLITRLPYLYEYDVTVDRIRDNHLDSTTTNLKSQHMSVATLYPLESVDRKTSRVSRRNYWFRLDNTGIGVLYGVDKSNPLLAYFDSLFRMGRPMIMNAHLVASEREGFSHYLMTRVNAAIPT